MFSEFNFKLSASTLFASFLLLATASATSINEFQKNYPTDDQKIAQAQSMAKQLAANVEGKRPQLAQDIRNYFALDPVSSDRFAMGLEDFFEEYEAYLTLAHDGKANLDKVQVESIVLDLVKENILNKSVFDTAIANAKSVGDFEMMPPLDQSQYVVECLNKAISNLENVSGGATLQNKIYHWFRGDVQYHDMTGMKSFWLNLEALTLAGDRGKKDLSRYPVELILRTLFNERFSGLPTTNERKDFVFNSSELMRASEKARVSVANAILLTTLADLRNKDRISQKAYIAEAFRYILEETTDIRGEPYYKDFLAVHRNNADWSVTSQAIEQAYAKIAAIPSDNQELKQTKLQTIIFNILEAKDIEILRQLKSENKMIDRKAAEIDCRMIKLHDGRRILWDEEQNLYVENETGKILTGNDAAEAREKDNEVGTQKWQDEYQKCIAKMANP